jgi:tRNA 2-selenouridine synthase
VDAARLLLARRQAQRRAGDRCSSRSAFASTSSRRLPRFPPRRRRRARGAAGALSWRVVCGPTGSGKSRLLDALAAAGAQVLDLERLANHRGSVLGLVPGSVQPSQKAFDTRLWDALRRLDPARPVFVESESKKIGDLRVPESLIGRMRASPCLWLELALDARVALLMADYDFFVTDVDAFCARLDALRALRGRAVVDSWQAAARAGRTAEVVRDLLVAHYDPIYLESMRRNFAGVGAPGRDLALGRQRCIAAREPRRPAIEGLRTSP